VVTARGGQGNECANLYPHELKAMLFSQYIFDLPAEHISVSAGVRCERDIRPTKIHHQALV
jgi:hypothetical protein